MRVRNEIEDIAVAGPIGEMDAVAGLHGTDYLAKATVRHTG